MRNPNVKRSEQFNRHATVGTFLGDAQMVLADLVSDALKLPLCVRDVIDIESIVRAYTRMHVRVFLDFKKTCSEEQEILPEVYFFQGLTPSLLDTPCPNKTVEGLQSTLEKAACRSSIISKTLNDLEGRFEELDLVDERVRCWSAFNRLTLKLGGLLELMDIAAGRSMPTGSRGHSS